MPPARGRGEANNVRAPVVLLLWGRRRARLALLKKRVSAPSVFAGDMNGFVQPCERGALCSRVGSDYALEGHNGGGDLRESVNAAASNCTFLGFDRPEIHFVVVPCPAIILPMFGFMFNDITIACDKISATYLHGTGALTRVQQSVVNANRCRQSRRRLLSRVPAPRFAEWPRRHESPSRRLVSEPRPISRQPQKRPRQNGAAFGVIYCGAGWRLI